MATTVEERTFTFDTIILDAHGRVVERFTGQAPGLTHVLRPGVGLDMVRIPGGAFLMGSPQGEGYPDERPQHVVTVGPFWMGRLPVTQAQWEAVMGPHRCRCQGAGRPVDRVSWDEAVAFCHRLLRCGAREGALRGRDYRLPTEAEWEYAARGPQGFVYPWGDEFEGSRLNYCDANCEVDWDLSADDGYERVAPVGSYPAGASWVGALDLAGNVWEWTADWYGAYTGDPQVNPTGPESGDRRVLRGVAWSNERWLVRSSYRDQLAPGVSSAIRGFRCAMSDES